MKIVNRIARLSEIVSVLFVTAPNTRHYCVDIACFVKRIRIQSRLKTSIVLVYGGLRGAVGMTLALMVN